MSRATSSANSKKGRRKLKRERGKERKGRDTRCVYTRITRSLGVSRRKWDELQKSETRRVKRRKKKKKEKKGERKKDAKFLGNFALNFNQTGRRFTAVHFVASSLICFVNARPEIQQDPMYRLIRSVYEVTVIYASFNSSSLSSLVSGQRWFYSPPAAGRIIRGKRWDTFVSQCIERNVEYTIREGRIFTSHGVFLEKRNRIFDADGNLWRTTSSISLSIVAELRTNNCLSIN